MTSSDLNLFLWRKALQKHKSKPSPTIIPLSRPGIYERNYYSISMENIATGDYHFVMNHDEQNIYTKRHVENADSVNDVIPMDALRDFRFHAKYYKKTHEFHFNSVCKFVLWSALKIPDLQYFFAGVDQWFYERRSLATHDRYKVLAYLMEGAIEDPNSEFRVLSVMAKLFGQQVVLHPEFKKRHAYYQLIFNSLESDGLIEKIEYSYKVSPKAVGALHQYQEEKSRYDAGVTIQRTLVWLTAIAAISTVAQALIAWIKG